jgi:oxygen-independent coproporphyrinogen III oxidase
MAGIYIHIPFCRKACHYCNFHFSTSLAQSGAMVDAIKKEMRLRSTENQETIETIYFGGGTPSLLKTEQINSILETASRLYTILPGAEITLEANPDDITSANALSWKAMGINRFSIGIQSFADKHLQWMNRAHDAHQSRQCIDVIQQAGFSNFSIDLIYGTPGQTQEDWIQDLSTALALNIPHLSCYAMTVEEGTALHSMIAQHKKEKVSEEEQAARFEALVNMMESNGYLHYEISNFALPGKESRHNSAYWEGKTYLGFGPSAHSFQRGTRSWNVSNNAAYLRGIDAAQPVFTEEILTETNMLNEYIMTALRASKGISKKKVLSQWGEKIFYRLEREIGPLVEQGKIEEDEETWKLCSSWKFFADGIAASLFQLD